MTKLSNTGANQPLEAVKGATFGPVYGRIRRTGTLAGDGSAYFDLTGCTVRGWVKKYINDPVDVATFICGLRDQTAFKGGYFFMLPATALMLLPIGDRIDSLASRYRYGIQLVQPSGRIISLQGGTFNISGS